ncbi:tail fiber domain-containing protein [Rahnella selenatireducens]|uniref:tail fiber domain-containing protein n=1 Tax=Rahnella selenatireducens TaxID=3389797 RepID=UPI003968ED37
MSAGTIALTNNSANVTGTGTAFTTDLKAGDFVVAIVGGVTHTLGVKAITSATALTLITAYGGPTASGNAWTAVPNATLVGITAQVAADVSKAIRGLNLDKANWQQVFSGTGTITVTLPDGSTYSGPAWNSLSNQLSGKAASGANSDITSLTGLTSAIGLGQGGTGAKNASDARANLGLGSSSTVNTGTSGAVIPLLSTSNTWSGVQNISATYGINHTGTNYTLAKPASALVTSGGSSFNYLFTVAGNTSVAAAVNGLYLFDGSYTGFLLQHTRSDTTARSWFFRQDGNAVGIGWVSTSDKRVKKDLEEIASPLERLAKITGYTYDLYGDRKAGLMAQDLENVLPEAVLDIGTVTDSDGNSFEDGKGVDYNAIIALLVQGINSLTERVKILEAKDAETQTN